MVSSAEYGPSVVYGERGEWCRGWSKGGLLLKMVQVWAIVNMVGGAKYGPSVAIVNVVSGAEDGPRGGLLLTW